MYLQVFVTEDDSTVTFIPNDGEGIGNVVEVKIRLVRRARTQPMASKLCGKICIEEGENILLVDYTKKYHMS